MTGSSGLLRYGYAPDGTRKDDDSQRGHRPGDNNISERPLSAQQPSSETSIKLESTGTRCQCPRSQVLYDEQPRRLIATPSAEREGHILDYSFPAAAAVPVAGSLDAGYTVHRVGVDSASRCPAFSRSSDAPVYIAMKALGPELSEAYEQERANSKMYERNTLDLWDWQQTDTFSGRKDQVPAWAITNDWPFEFEAPMTGIPPLSEPSWTPESYYASPSTDSLTGDCSVMGSFTDLKMKNKRSPGDSTVYDSDSDAECPTSVKRAKHSSGDNETKPEAPTYACPFLKKHPHKHRDCARYVFKRVRDVKQHLNRSHRTPDFYCARCYKLFSSAKDRDEHSRDEQCQVQANPRFEGISEEQKDLLMQNKGRKKSHEEQWFLIVYRCNPQEEAVVLLRDVWNTRHREFLADIKPGMATVDVSIHSLMEKIFSRLEWESRVPSQPARKPSKAMAKTATAAPDYMKMADGDVLPWEDLVGETNLQLPSPPYQEN
ncbi:hypothetical protein PG994_004084 [Apiospora phragmitis]|uniref:C2H2-type domain-containing protein n=1 Tax=Apiospora phragmitis TaxID=2905665 RepID=A0ABR1VPL6_9PEZI